MLLRQSNTPRASKWLSALRFLFPFSTDCKPNTSTGDIPENFNIFPHIHPRRPQGLTCFGSYNFNRWPYVWNQQVTGGRMRQACLWRYRRLSSTAGSKRLCVLISPGLQFMAIMAVYFQPLWWILLNYWPLWGRDGFASVLQIAGHHCDIQVKSTWHTEQVLTDYESECKTSRVIIINGWGVLMARK